MLAVVHNFVEAPLVTLGVNGVWNNDNDNVAAYIKNCHLYI